MSDLDEVWAYDEPHESGGNIHITMSKKQAIDWIKKIYPIMNDEDAFFEWCVVHWAYKENAEEGKKS